jgi:putative hydrolase of the HAD superfamily
VDLPPAILLDLDDTIVAFDEVADDCWRLICTRNARQTGVTAERLFAAISRSRQWFWSDPERHRTGRRNLQAARRQIVRHAFRELELDEAVAEQVADEFTEERDRRGHLVLPFPGALATIEHLRQRGVQLALVTNGEARSQRAKIERFDLARHFDCIVIEGELGAGKPDPAVFLHALSVLRREPHDAWMVGDSLVFDIAPALKLGIFSVWIDRFRAGPPAEAQCKPDRIIGSLLELMSLAGS